MHCSEKTGEKVTRRDGEERASDGSLKRQRKSGVGWAGRIVDQRQLRQPRSGGTNKIPNAQPVKAYKANPPRWGRKR